MKGSTALAAPSSATFTARRVPAKILEVNLRAFALGRDAVGAEDAEAL